MYIYFVAILLSYLSAKQVFLLTGITPIKLLPVAMCLLGVIRFAFFDKGRVYLGQVVNKIDFTIYWGFILIYFFSILRIPGETTFIGMFNETAQVISIVIFTYAFVNFAYRESDDFFLTTNKIVEALITAPVLLITINVIAFLGGVEPPPPDSEGALITLQEEDPTPTIISTLLGLDIGRSSLLFMIHTNNAAVMVGAIVFAISLGWRGLYLESIKKWLFATGFVCGLVALMILDSRGALGSCFIVIIAAIMLQRFKKLGVFKPLTWFVPILPFFMMTIFTIVGNSELGKSMSRKDVEDGISSGNGRAYIWEHCIDAIFEPEVGHILGYGQVGHITSGVSEKWKWKFPGYVTHNFVFQTFFDLGYMGLLFFMLVLHNSAKSALFLYRRGVKSMVIFIPFSVYYLLSGMFESIFGVYNHYYTSLVIMFTFFPLLIKNEYLKQSIAQLEVAKPLKDKINLEPTRTSV